MDGSLKSLVVAEQQIKLVLQNKASTTVLTLIIWVLESEPAPSQSHISSSPPQQLTTQDLLPSKHSTTAEEPRPGIEETRPGIEEIRTLLVNYNNYITKTKDYDNFQRPNLLKDVRTLLDYYNNCLTKTKDNNDVKESNFPKDVRSPLIYHDNCFNISGQNFYKGVCSQETKGLVRPEVQKRFIPLRCFRHEQLPEPPDRCIGFPLSELR
ncbi:hypothetical protein K457DRAFT_1877956 [Linnemannia elongata AG-77]|uniref:Uncharacterized protein n=1 Tax=Linnemannia elongata AG-77 TaxID=1314771 RepID=A0A197JQX3_9FUNG|nr:hypothetical protein K457DRAFT_1877956 [Linnemannia elongata AG-77]